MLIVPLDCGWQELYNSHDCLACDSSAQLARPGGKSQAFRSGVIQLPETIGLQKGLERRSQLWYKWPSMSARLDVTEGFLKQGLPSRVGNTDLSPSGLPGQPNTHTPRSGITAYPVSEGEWITCPMLESFFFLLSLIQLRKIEVADRISEWKADRGFNIASQLGRCLAFLTHPCILLQVAERLMTIAYESGVNLFDTAEVYAAGK